MKLSTDDLLRAARAERMSEGGRTRLLETTVLASASKSAVGPTLTPSRSNLWWLKACMVVCLSAAALGTAAMQPWSTPRVKAPHVLEGVARATKRDAPVDSTAAAPAAPTATVPSAATIPSASHTHAATMQSAAPQRSEAEFLARVRTDLKEGHLAAASRELSAYFALYPQGQLQLEARVLRVRTNHAASHKAEATQEARTLLKAYPNNPYRAELEQVAGSL